MQTGRAKVKPAGGHRSLCLPLVGELKHLQWRISVRSCVSTYAIDALRSTLKRFQTGCGLTVAAWFHLQTSRYRQLVANGGACYGEIVARKLPYTS
jgi:hypothetical protein